MLKIMCILGSLVNSAEPPLVIPPRLSYAETQIEVPESSRVITLRNSTQHTVTFEFLDPQNVTFPCNQVSGIFRVYIDGKSVHFYDGKFAAFRLTEKLYFWEEDECLRLCSKPWILNGDNFMDTRPNRNQIALVLTINEETGNYKARLTGRTKMKEVIHLKEANAQ